MFDFDYVYKVFVPVDSMSEENFDHLEAILMGHFGGFTRYENMFGAWQNPETRKSYYERVHIYEICLNRKDWERHFQHITDFIMGNSKEESVLITKSPIEMTFYNRKDYHD